MVIMERLVNIHVKITILIHPYINFHTVPNFRRRVLNRGMLTIGRRLRHSLCLTCYPLSLVRHARGEGRRVKVVFSFIRVRIMFIVIVNTFVNIRVVLWVVFRHAVNDFNNRRVPVLTEVNTNPWYANPNIPRRGRNEKAKLRDGRRWRARRHGRNAYKVAFSGFRYPNNRTFYNYNDFPDHDHTLLYDLLYLLTMLPTGPLLLPMTNGNVFHRLQILLYNNIGVMIHHMFNVTNLNLTCRFYQVFPSFATRGTKTIPRHNFSRGLEAIYTFYTSVFLFRFGGLTVRRTIGKAANGATCTFCQTKLFQQLLFYRLLPNLFRLFTLKLRIRLYHHDLFLLTLFTRLKLQSALSQDIKDLQPKLFPIENINNLQPDLLLNLVHFSFRSSCPPNK